ncbi:MAG: L,D-transpeptidase family protein [Paracoccaceae bacterium]
MNRTDITRRRAVAGLGALALLTACGPSKFLTYDGPPVTSVVLFKEQRMLLLMNGQSALRTYDVELGFAPVGHKQVSGDGRTPEGAYMIDRRNPNSEYHLSLGINYPNTRDHANAVAMGMDPGGNIFIHGTDRPNLGREDWTWGCIAVTNDEIEEIYAMVQDMTPMYIYP